MMILLWLSHVAGGLEVDFDEDRCSAIWSARTGKQQATINAMQRRGVEAREEINLAGRGCHAI